MTKKDYVLIAAALKEGAFYHQAATKDSDEQYRLCCTSIADALGRENDRFDRARFLDACGVQS